MPNTYIVKRKSEYADNASFDYDLSKNWFADAAFNRKTSYLDDLAKGDKIYIAESGYAIIGEGVLEKVEPHMFEKMDDFLHFCLYEKKTDADLFWYHKMKNYFRRKEEFNSIYVTEVKIGKQKPYEVPILLDEKYKLTQLSWRRLNHKISLDEISKSSNELMELIPTQLRKNIYHEYKMVFDEFILDIDHHVPKSLGGPGNIIENLVPIGRSLNRSKSDSVPSKLFDYGRDYDIDIPANLEINHDKYYSEGKLKTKAKEIINKVNREELEKARSIYHDIKTFHFPALA